MDRNGCGCGCWNDWTGVEDPFMVDDDDDAPTNDEPPLPPNAADDDANDPIFCPNPRFFFVSNVSKLGTFPFEMVSSS